MKRLQISLEPELDQQLGRVARERGVSKAEVIRVSLRDQLGPVPRLEDDPIFKLFGSGTGAGLKPGESIDEIVYGRKARDDLR